MFNKSIYFLLLKFTKNKQTNTVETNLFEIYNHLRFKDPMKQIKNQLITFELGSQIHIKATILNTRWAWTRKHVIHNFMYKQNNFCIIKQQICSYKKTDRMQTRLSTKTSHTCVPIDTTLHVSTHTPLSITHD